MKKIIIIVTALILAILLTGCSFIRKIQEIRGYTGGSYDYSNKHAPKTIKSKEITSFEYSFLTYPMYQYGDRKIPYKERCDFSLIREENWARCTGSGGYEGLARFEFEFLAPLSALDDLQAIVDKHNIAEVNGIITGAVAIPEDLGASIYIGYESKEYIKAADNTGPILNGRVDVDLYDFFLNLAKEADESFMYSDEEYEKIYYMLTDPDGFATLDGGRSIKFDGYDVYIYEGEKRLLKEGIYIKENKIYSYYLNGDLGPYSHLVLEEGLLYAIEEDGSKIRFYPVIDSLDP